MFSSRIKITQFHAYLNDSKRSIKTVDLSKISQHPKPKINRTQSFLPEQIPPKIIVKTPNNNQSQNKLQFKLNSMSIIFNGS